MAIKHVSDKRAEGLATIEGKEQTHLDDRILYDPIINWKDEVTISDIGHEYIRLDKVNQLIIENEMLRQSLYANQDFYYNRVVYLIDNMVGKSTSDIIKMVAKMSKMTKNIIKETEIYAIIYAIFVRNMSVDFSKRKHQESKLQYIWKIGALPLVSMITSSLYQVFLTFEMTDRQTYTEFLSKMSAKINKKSLKCNNIRNSVKTV